MTAVDRRRFLRLAGATGLVTGGAAGLAACGDGSPHPQAGTASASDATYLSPHSAQVDAAERARTRNGEAPRHVAVTPEPVTVDLAGTHVDTWAYGNGAVGTQLIRARVGDLLQARLTNKLPEQTTVHWHGIEIRNDMDGVAPITQAAPEPGRTFDYGFTLATAGTYWYHSHIGVQADRGLFGPLVVDDPDDLHNGPDEVLVLDDWLDGLGTTPNDVLHTLNSALGGMNMAGMSMTASAASTAQTPTASSAARVARQLVMTSAQHSTALNSMGGVINYPMHLINGRPPKDRVTIRATRGMPIRLRIVNAAAETAYRVAVGGHRMTVTHADGRPVEPFETDTLVVGMAERYDVTVTPASGAWPVVARAEGKPGYAAAVLRTRDAVSASPPPLTAMPAELGRQLLRYQDLRPTGAARLATKPIDRHYYLDLVGDMARYVWGIAGKDAANLEVHRGQRVAISMRNTTAMWHPMHLHGHTFAVDNANGIRKDTVNVLPGETVTVQFDAVNPGQWMLHCHNAYHMEAGMTTNLNYLD